MGNPMEEYAGQLAIMTDGELEKEWLAGDGPRLRNVEHEMAVRFMRRNKERADRVDYFTEKFLKMPERFSDAFRAKDWSRAKYIYDSAIVVGLFLELPEHIRIKAFGSRQDEEDSVDGLFHEAMLNKVMKECVIKNRLGFECVVYRVPGEVGFYGARHLPGTRRMAAGENPASGAT